MRGVVVIKADGEIGKIFLMLDAHVGDHLFRRDPLLLCLEHNRGAVSIVGADEVNLFAAHSLKTDPNISLDMFQHMTEMD